MSKRGAAMRRGLKYTATRMDIVNSFYDEVQRLLTKYEFQREAILALDEIESLACWWANAPATRMSDEPMTPPAGRGDA